MLIYTAITSLDGYIEDADGRFDWARPDDEVHRFVNDGERSIGIYLYGRRLYETMAVWETEPGLAARSEVMRDYARIWRAADKVVYSTTLAAPLTERTRIEREFRPRDVAALKETSTTDLSIGGAEIAGRAFGAGLVDECRLLVAPVIVGGGKRALPVGVFLLLELLEERRFDGGTVYLRYAVRDAGTSMS